MDRQRDAEELACLLVQAELRRKAEKALNDGSDGTISPGTKEGLHGSTRPSRDYTPYFTRENVRLGDALVYQTVVKRLLGPSLVRSTLTELRLLGTYAAAVRRHAALASECAMSRANTPVIERMQKARAVRVALAECQAARRALEALRRRMA